MARKKKHEEHQNHEAWAIPYGDLVTLLFALFTVMYAMSSVNEGKYRVLSDSLVAAFRGTPKSPEPIKVNKDQTGKGGDTRLTGVRPTALLKLPDLRQPGPTLDEKQLPRAGLEQHPPDHDPKAGFGPEAERGKALAQMGDQVKQALQGLIDRQLVHVRQTPFALEVEIKTDILFPSGVAKISPGARPVLDKIAGILKPFANAIRVEGHTDNRPIATAAFPSNWELSAARAANVVQLFTKAGVDPLRMQVLGLGEFRPVAANTSVEGRNSNRRVLIVVMESKGTAEGADPVEQALRAATGVTATPGPTVLVQRPAPKKEGT